MKALIPYRKCNLLKQKSIINVFKTMFQCIETHANQALDSNMTVRILESMHVLHIQLEDKK